MTWRDRIKDVGLTKVANELSIILGREVKYPTVYKYVNPEVMAFPDNRKDGMMKPLCAAMKKHLSYEEFIDFMNSLSAEITGFSTESTSSVQDNQAQG